VTAVSLTSSQERKQAQAMYGKSARVPKRARVLLNAAANPVAATTSASTTSANTSTATAAGSKTSKKSAREDGVTDAPVAKRARLSAADEAVLVVRCVVVAWARVMTRARARVCVCVCDAVCAHRAQFKTRKLSTRCSVWRRQCATACCQQA
jgi:hypothetical protein